jgi:hypothetical protein
MDRYINLLTYPKSIWLGIIFLSDVFIWRSIWNLIDIYIFPDNFQLSNWVTLIIGLAGYLLTLLLYHYIDLSSYLIIILLNFSSVFIWRSIWNLIDIYVIPDDFELSNWVTLIIGVTGYLITLLLYREFFQSKYQKLDF